MIILDGAVIVNMVKPNNSQTFAGYGNTFVTYVRNRFSGSVRRVDIVFNVYLPDSLKLTTRQKIGKGSRRRVEANKSVPNNWSEFLRINETKKELFELLSDKVATATFPGTVIITRGQIALSTDHTSVDRISPCTHEEADTRMILHAADGSSKGHNRIMIRTVDTDVVVLALSNYWEVNCNLLCIAFGAGKSFRYLHVAAIANALGPEKCVALLAFHAITGSDTTSSFTAWITWNAFQSDV